jgi:hypothetical protein
MSSLGYGLVSDDVLAVGLKDSMPGAWPYLRRLKLKQPPISELALTPTEQVGDTLDRRKYFVPMKYVADDQWGSLNRIYLLENDPTGEGVSIEPVSGLEAVRVLIDQTYHFQFILGAGLFREHLKLCARIASIVPVFRLRRSPSIGLESGLGCLIRTHLETPRS